MTAIKTPLDTYGHTNIIDFLILKKEYARNIAEKLEFLNEKLEEIYNEIRDKDIKELPLKDLLMLKDNLKTELNKEQTTSGWEL